MIERKRIALFPSVQHRAPILHGQLARGQAAPSAYREDDGDPRAWYRAHFRNEGESQATVVVTTAIAREMVSFIWARRSRMLP